MNPPPNRVPSQPLCAGEAGRAGPPDPPNHIHYPQRHKLPHNTPSWVASGAIFFITVNALPHHQNQLCLPEHARVIRESAAFRHTHGDWWLYLLVLMPDHLHMLAAFPQEKSMRQVVFKWKEFVAKKLSLHWQRDFFDHRLRNDESLVEKAHYIRMNPVRKGLCQDMCEWAYAWDDFHTLAPAGGSGGPALPARTGQPFTASMDESGGSGGPALPALTVSMHEAGRAGPPAPPPTALT